MVIGTVSAIQKMSSTVLKRGNIAKLELEQATLLIKSSDYTIIGLLSEKSSKFLEDCIDNFIIEFEKIFSNILKDDISDLSLFNNVNKIVENNFTFRPS